MKRKTDIVQLFAEKNEEGSYLKVSAPMVRYSKLEFRSLLRKYGVDLCFTPMIMADSFCRSENARQNEFTTNQNDTPLIVQFAAKKCMDMLMATQLVYEYSDGVDLNCGCPQRWAVTSGYGCALLKDPQLVCDIVKTLRRNISNSFSVSVKLRLLQKNIASTIDLCRQLESTGVTFLTIHGRTPWQKCSEPVDVEAIAEIKKSLHVPVIANGDIRTLKDANDLYNSTGCNGVMVARGLLSNPTLFTGETQTTRQCIQDWINLGYSINDRITFMCFHHHLTFMMEKLMRKRQRAVFNNFTKKEQIYEFLRTQFSIVPHINDNQILDNLSCLYDTNLCNTEKSGIFDENNRCQLNGKYFTEFCQIDPNDNVDDNIESLDIMGKSIFCV